MKTGASYEDMPFPELKSFEVDGMPFKIASLNLEKLFERSLSLNFKHILRYYPPDIIKAKQEYRFDAVFYTCAKGIIMYTQHCSGMVLNTKISYVRGARNTPSPVIYFCAWKEIRVVKTARIRFYGSPTSYVPSIFMTCYNKKLEKAKKIYDKCKAGKYHPASKSDEDKFRDSDPDTGVYIDGGGTVFFVKINNFGRYFYYKVVNIEKIEKYLK